MAKNSVRQWDIAEANNLDIQSISLAEGITLPSQVNGFERAHMAQVAQYVVEMSYPTAGGTADALTLTPTTALAALASNVVYTLTPASSNATTTPTLNVSSLGAKVIRKISAGADIAVAAGDLVQGQPARLIYSTAANTGGGAWILINPATIAAPTVFSDSVFRIQDNGDATKQLAFEVSGITTGNTRTATPPNSSFIMAALDVAAQVVTGGTRVTSNALGTISSGTTTLDPGTRPLWDYTNNGAHTLAPGANTGTIVLDITNGASAGAITVSGWTKVVGAFDTTNAHKFRCMASIGAAGSLLTIQPMF